MPVDEAKSQTLSISERRKLLRRLDAPRLLDPNVVTERPRLGHQQRNIHDLLDKISSSRNQHAVQKQNEFPHVPPFSLSRKGTPPTSTKTAPFTLAGTRRYQQHAQTEQLSRQPSQRHIETAPLRKVALETSELPAAKLPATRDLAAPLPPTPQLPQTKPFTVDESEFPIAPPKQSDIKTAPFRDVRLETKPLTRAQQQLKERYQMELRAAHNRTDHLFARHQVKKT